MLQVTRVQVFWLLDMILRLLVRYSTPCADPTEIPLYLERRKDCPEREQRANWNSWLVHTHKSGVSKLVPANCLGLRLRPPMAQAIHWRHWRLGEPLGPSVLHGRLVLDLGQDRIDLRTDIPRRLKRTRGMGWHGKKGPLKMHAREKSPVFFYVYLYIRIDLCTNETINRSFLPDSWSSTN